MDPHRFDSLTRKLGTRLSRRGAIRAGAGVALGAVALGKLAPASAQDPGTSYKDRFISIRTYAYTGSIEDAAAGLQGLVTLMEQQPGFISIDFVDGDDAIHVVATFLDKSSAVAAAKQEDQWIADNAADILAGKPEINSGPVFLRSELGTQCGCTTGVEHPCSSDDLICCPTAGILDGGPGICLTAATTCPAQDIPPAPAPTTEPAPTEVPACTGEGCACNGGVDGACDDGLVCCGVSEPGGAGTCLTEAECNPPCTGEGCACNGGVEGACDDGLTCCTGVDGPGSAGQCLSSCGCTGEGCACTTGVGGNCDSGLVCCAADMTDPGSPGTCMASCDSSDCNGQENCPCTAGVEGTCAEGLECCGASEPGGEGTCLGSCG